MSLTPSRIMGAWGSTGLTSVSPGSHHSGEVPVGAFCRVPGAGAAPPCALRALEEQSFLFQLHAPQQPPPDAKEVGGAWGWGYEAASLGEGSWGCH